MFQYDDVSLLQRSFRIPPQTQDVNWRYIRRLWGSCDFKIFYCEIDYLKTISRISCIKSFLNKLYAPKIVVHNVPERNVFVKLLFLRSASSQIRNKLQKLFSDKLTLCNLEKVFTSPVRFKAFSPSSISYLRGYFQDLFGSLSVVDAMLSIMVRRNAILKSEFMNI